MPSRRLSLAFAALAAAGAVPAALAATSPSSARFDGRWSVEVITREGRCDSYKWNIDVRAGRVIDVEGRAINTAGGVDGRGRVAMTIVNGSEQLTARGDMDRDLGYGTWQAPSRQCAGDWRATAVQQGG